MGSRVVILVPWRGGEPTREYNWRVVRPYLDAFGWEVFLGDRKGPWSRAAACNQAAKDAGDWDIALIADADTIPEREAVHRAVEMVGNGAIRPHDRLWNLSKLETRMVVRHGPQILQKPRRLLLGGGLLVVSRAAWDTVGGYDERFVQWGHEDSAINTRLLVEANWDRIEGNAWHLNHTRDDTDTPERAENRRMMTDIQRTHYRAIRRISRERGWDVGRVL